LRKDIDKGEKMSKVFIAWSGNFETAKKLGEYISARAGYEAIVGGNLHELNTIYVGGTIIDQMKKCDQAILLIQKNASSNLSANLMFEWGYLLAKLNANKIHNYLINLEPNDSALPSDLHGVWSYTLKTEGLTEEEIVNNLGEKFFASQKNTVNTNKMTIINNRDETRRLVRAHNADPICSNYEMAQYVMCYIYCAYIYEDSRDETLEDLQTFLRDLSPNAKQSSELFASLKCAINSVKLYKRVRFTGDEQYMLLDDFYEIRDEYEDILDLITDMDDGEVKVMLKALIYGFIVYLYLLVTNGKELEPEKRAEYCKRLYDIALRTEKYINEFYEAAPEQNKQFCELLRSYIYRNMFCAQTGLEELESKGLTERTMGAEDRKAVILECLKNSLEQRRRLYNMYKDGTASVTFINNIEMEYFLALAEFRLYETDEYSREESRKRLKRYVQKAERIAAEKRIFTEKIKKYIEN